MRIRNTEKCLEPESEPPFCLEPTQIAPGPRTSQKSGGPKSYCSDLIVQPGRSQEKKRGGVTLPTLTRAAYFLVVRSNLKILLKTLGMFAKP